MSQSVTDSDTETITDFDGEYDADSDTWGYNWEGRTFTFDDHTKFKIEEQLVMVKIRYEQDPEEFLSDNIEGNKEIVSNHLNTSRGLKCPVRKADFFAPLQSGFLEKISMKSETNSLQKTSAPSGYSGPKY